MLCYICQIFQTLGGAALGRSNSLFSIRPGPLLLPF